jgi:mannitol/fructose-specific phosphotransferase system IIA component (Ntr-type)
VNPTEPGFFPGLVDERRIFPDLAGSTLEEALSEMSNGLARTGVVSDGADLTRRLVERERMGSTGLGEGLAIPHCKLREIADVVLAVGVSRRGIDFGAADGLPVRLVFLVLSPADAPALHLQALARISRVIRLPGVAERLVKAETAGEIAAALKEAEGRLAVSV